RAVRCGGSGAHGDREGMGSGLPALRPRAGGTDSSALRDARGGWGRMRKRIALLIGFAVLASFAFAGVPGGVAASTSTPNRVVDYETITGSLNADGSLSRVRLLDDLRVYGTGSVTVTDPVATEGLRNLLGFSGPEPVGDNNVRYTINDLSGSKQFLTVSTPDRQVPLAMSVGYTLNGQSINGSDLVGKSG